MKTRWHLLLLVLGVLFLFPHAADAEVISHTVINDQGTSLLGSNRSANDFSTVSTQVFVPTVNGSVKHVQVQGDFGNYPTVHWGARLYDYGLGIICYADDSFQVTGVHDGHPENGAVVATWHFVDGRDSGGTATGDCNVTAGTKYILSTTFHVATTSGTVTDLNDSGYFGDSAPGGTNREFGYAGGGTSGSSLGQSWFRIYTNADVPPPDTPTDPIGTTGVITPIVAPAFPPIATTSSPIAITFGYTIATTSDERFTHYRLQFKNADSGAILNRYGLLDDSTVGSYFQSTSSPLTGDGTWEVFIGLVDPDPSAPTGWRYAERASHTFFGLNTVTSTGEFQDYLPPQQSSFASSSCAVNFLGTFDLPTCIGYLIVPTVGTGTPISNLQNVTLRDRFPFAYAYQVGDLRDLLFTASSTATTSVSVTVGTSTNAWHITFLSREMMAAIPLSGTVKTILTWLLWFMLAEFVYHRILRAHDKTS